MEVLFYTDSSGNPNNINAIDIATGQPQAAFKGGSSFPNTLCFLNHDYVVSALPKKSVLHVYEMNRRGQQCLRTITPGVPKSLCISVDGSYIAAGIGERILVWNAVTGDLLAALAKHYQDVNQLCFTNDASCLISAGLDGLLSVWDMADVIDTYTSEPVEPFMCLSSHVLPVTQVRCGSIGGCSSRVFTSSLDRTLKIHDISLRATVLTLVFAKGVSAFCVDSPESTIVAGASDGTLFKVDLIAVAKDNLTSNTSSINVEPENKANGARTVFKGHEQSVTCLEFSFDATRFVSGSADRTIKVWDVFSVQVLRTIDTKDAVTNLRLTLAPPYLTSPDYKPSCVFPKLSKAVANTSGDCDELLQRTRLDQQFYGDEVGVSRLDETVAKCRAKKSGNELNVNALKRKADDLQEVNRKLFNFAANHLLSS